MNDILDHIQQQRESVFDYWLGIIDGNYRIILKPAAEPSTSKVYRMSHQELLELKKFSDK